MHPQQCQHVHSGPTPLDCRTTTDLHDGRLIASWTRLIRAKAVTKLTRPINPSSPRAHPPTSKESRFPMILYKKSVVICCVCWRSHYGEFTLDQDPEGWRELDALIADEHLGADDYILSQGYCPTCLEAFLQESHARQLTTGPGHSPVSPPALYTVGSQHRP